MTKNEILTKIELLESEGKFNEEVVPPANLKKAEVKKDFNYTRKGLKAKLNSAFINPLFKLVALVISNHFRLKVIGKKNLKKMKKAIVTSNHINNIDCLLIRKALWHKKLKITVAEFNNFKGILGYIMRSAGTMPFGNSFECAKNISDAISELLDKNNMIVFYPEHALWWCYEKPRPTQKGAYYFASKNKVPILPLFFTFKNLKQKKDGTYKKKFFLHIGEPIYPLEENDTKQNIEYLQNKDFEWRKNVYEEFYGKKLIYNIENSADVFENM